jgi:hypothetical protein
MANQENRFFAFGGVVKERTNGGALSQIVVECSPKGRAFREFGCPQAAAMAERIAAFLNAEATAEAEAA